jgi:hypothetical protein
MSKAHCYYIVSGVQLIRAFQLIEAACWGATGPSSAFALAWRNYSPRSITPRFYECFCVPLQLGANNWGYWPSDSVFDQGGGVHHKLLMFSHLDGTEVLRLIRRTRAIEVKQLAQGCKQAWQ